MVKGGESINTIKFGKTKFLGVEFTLKDGSTTFIEPHRKVKKQIEKTWDRLHKP